jgi:hypothetical protein
LLILALVAVPATAFAQIPVGTRVGMPAPSAGYDDGGRRDPFSSLVVKRMGGPSPTSTPTVRGTSLVTLSVGDIKCTGVLKSGSRFHSAIIEGPNKLSFLVKPQDRLLDGVVKSIDALGVVLIEHTTDSTGAVEGKEVRKLLHPAAEVIR